MCAWNVRALGLLAVVALAVCAAPARAEVTFPEADSSEKITIAAHNSTRWQQGQHEVWILEGDVSIAQGSTVARAPRAVCWIRRQNEAHPDDNRVIVYLESEAEQKVVINYLRGEHRARMQDDTWLGDFTSTAQPELRMPRPRPEPPVRPAIYARAVQRRDASPRSAVRQAQFTQPMVEAAPTTVLPPGTRSLRAFPLTGTGVPVRWYPSPGGNEGVAVIESGVNLIIDGVGNLGSIDIQTDRMVIWTAGTREPDLGGNTLQSADTPLEIYMEGNIVFREGERIIHAERMYYDVRNQVGTVLQAEVLTPVPQFDGLMRLKADVVQQIGRDRFFARNGYITPSRFAQPGYRIQSSDVYFEDNQVPLIDPATGEPILDSATGEQIIDHNRLATAYNNFLFLGPVPVFYWPVFATDLEQPTFYIRNFRVKNDQIFGTQILTDWDGYELLGIKDPPAGTDLNLSADYLSLRGPAGGATYRWNRNDNIFGLPGPHAGFVDAWGVHDEGVDNLGGIFNNITPDKVFRYRVLGRHRHELPNNYTLSAEVGWISDNNFLESYYEVEWDELKDQDTGLELKKLDENASWSITGDTRLNNFFTTTEWYPRGDHFWLGKSLLNDLFTWYEHTNVGYAKYRIASPPSNQTQLDNFTLLPWEQTSNGERIASRQEIDLPLSLGPVKIVPYVLGEAAHWGEDLSGNDLQRLYGQAGVRASIPFWAANPAVESGLWNVHGLAHKVVFDTEFLVADANQNVDQLPLYDAPDDDSILAFRRQIPTLTYGTGSTPAQFDERYYAIRTGAAGWVTSPSTEIVEDLTAMRLGMRHRWQTKRGLPGQRRIIDWITLDTGATWFPDDNRDNFGEPFGLLNYDFRWHVGDRVTILSDGAYDFFDQGQKTVSIGGFITRPPRGSLYIGYRLLEGPFKSQVINASYSYLMSPKWISTFGSSVDLGSTGNIGQYMTITRIGESFLVSLGFNIDALKNNTGVNLAVEPRFLPKGRLNNVGGARIPIAGLYGLE